MLKRTLVLVMVVVVALAFSMSGCGKKADTGGGSTSQTTINVIMPKHEMDTIGLYEQKTRQFETDNPGIKVNLINQSWDNVADKITTDLTAGGGSYDVIEFDNSWVAKFSANDWLEPLDGYPGADVCKAGMLPGLIDKFSMNGSLYGLTWNNDTRFFMYNKKMLDDAGIANPPKTWDELVADSKILQQKKICKYGYIDSYMQAQSGTNELTYMVYSFGGKQVDDQGNPVFATDPNTAKAYQFLADGLNKDKIIDPASLTADYQTAESVFLAGNTAFFIQAWPGVYSDSNNADMSSVVGQVAVADYAVSSDPANQVVLTLPEALAIPKTSKNKDAAWKYIQYMTSKDFDKERGLQIGALPVWSDLFNDSDLLAKYPYWEQFGKQAAFAKGEPDLLWYDQLSNIVSTESQKILLGKVSVAKGLQSIQDQSVKAKNSQQG